MKTKYERECCNKRTQLCRAHTNCVFVFRSLEIHSKTVAEVLSVQGQGGGHEMELYTGYGVYVYGAAIGCNRLTTCRIAAMSFRRFWHFSLLSCISLLKNNASRCPAMFLLTTAMYSGFPRACTSLSKSHQVHI